MSDVQREPCRHCGESAAPSLKVCPFCQGSLRVDVVIATPFAEPRMRYLLAREISALGPPAPSFSTLRRELAFPRPVLARRASRLAALSLSERLADFGIAAILEPAGSGQGSGRSARRLPGGDGGPVLDGQGRVLGLVAIQPDGAYLLPVNYAYTESRLAAPPRFAPNLRKWTDLLAEAEAAERLRIGPPR